MEYSLTSNYDVISQPIMVLILVLMEYSLTIVWKAETIEGFSS